MELVTDESFADAALRALEALDELGRPARSADRSRLVRDLGLPRNVFAWLGRRRAIEPDPGGPPIAESSPGSVGSGSET